MSIFVVFNENENQYVHRCGRAGRKQMNSSFVQSESYGKQKDCITPTVYSFFNRELAPMARDVLELLQSCNAWIDPNLKALAAGSDNNVDKKGTKRRRKQSRCINVNSENFDKLVSSSSNSKKSSATEGLDYPKRDDEDEFDYLGTKKIVLQRASHVSDVESDNQL